MLGVEIAPLILRESAVGGLEEIDRHLLRTVEIQRSTVIPGNSIVVQVCLVPNLERRVVQNFAVRSDAGVMSEFGFRSEERRVGKECL